MECHLILKLLIIIEIRVLTDIHFNSLFHLSPIELFLQALMINYFTGYYVLAVTDVNLTRFISTLLLNKI
jgi:hypothetical protein